MAVGQIKKQTNKQVASLADHVSFSGEQPATLHEPDLGTFSNQALISSGRERRELQ